MSVIGRIRRRFPGSSAQSIDAWTREADAALVQQVDHASAQPRPSTIGPTYVDQEFHALGDEQELVWSAEGERTARPSQVRARGLDQATAATAFLLTESETAVRQAHADHQHAARVLTPYVRRESAAKLRYWIAWVILVLGDMTGVWAAAVMHGEVPAIAFGQALASGVAAGCSGLVGAEVKYLRMARDRVRDLESLTDDERRYQRLFGGSDRGVGLVGLVGLVSLAVVLLLASGIFILRASTEGSAAGLMFGLLAAATALGSFLLGYSAADEVADLLAATAKRATQAEKRHLKLAASPVFTAQAKAEATARSLREEHRLRGQAAGKRFESLAWRVQRRHPEVFGHGYPAGEQSGVIGRRTRRRSLSMPNAVNSTTLFGDVEDETERTR